MLNVLQHQIHGPLTALQIGTTKLEPLILLLIAIATAWPTTLIALGKMKSSPLSALITKLKEKIQKESPALERECACMILKKSPMEILVGTMSSLLTFRS